ncbi:hypothetical protein E2C01_077304 [Portunus trituberculatus]|nr:hypothetical protein [Portunus trituberculatus]
MPKRDSSTESNDASSPVPQLPHYQHPQTQQHRHFIQQQQQPQPQQQGAAGGGAGGRVGPHPLPPVRHAR